MKDFGQTIPGHGGVTDRFDCQMIMAMFAYVYYWNYVASTELTVGDALDVSDSGDGTGGCTQAAACLHLPNTDQLPCPGKLVWVLHASRCSDKLNHIVN